MAADSKQNLKQLRVDNWAIFFLQRLQLLFAKGDQCDLTLKFVSGQELKVHRLVLSTSTSFFESMERKGNVIHLPESLPYGVVQPIINFLYSGRLEFKAELYTELLSIAKIMKLAILARILIAQKNENGIGDNSSGKLLDVKKLKQTPTKSPSQVKYVNVLAGKKLPIWKKRTVPYKIERKPIKEEEPRPTRFEWPDEESCNNLILTSPSFSSLSYESDPVITPATRPLSSSPEPPLSCTPLKRRVVPPKSSIPDKIFKADGNVSVLFDNDSNKKQQPLSSDQSATATPSDEINVSDDDDDDGHFETIHTYGDSDEDLDGPLENDTPVSSLKPILKPMSDTPLQTPSKKVRFSFTPEDKENKNEKPIENVETTPKGKSVVQSVERTSDISKKTEKIIQEVLKKYPDLVRNNRNIKLKITAPGSPNQNTIVIDTKKRLAQGKSSYIVLKPAGKTDVQNVSSEEIEKPTKTPVSPAPPPPSESPKTVWKCESCRVGKQGLKFNTEDEYKKHLQDKHTEKLIDSRICEFCGYKATKRNLHLYHLYTKHGVDPPKNVKFPKCTQCSYIALSDSLLVKHLNSHQQAKDLTCQVCNTTFKTYSSLHVHNMSCKPNIGVRSYPCPNCERIFKTNVSLNAHLKVCSAKKSDEDDGDGGGDGGEGGSGNVVVGGDGGEGDGIEESSDVIEVPIIETVDINKGEHALVQIPSGIILAENPNVALLPTSESESLNNVASNIATSIGLTVAIPQEHQQAVILLDSNSQFFLQNDSVVVQNDSDVEEYIVPELLRDEMGQIYTTQNVPYTVSSTGVITCPVMSIEPNSNQVDKVKCNKENSTSSYKSDSFTGGTLLHVSEEIDNQTIVLDSADTHLESSSTRVEIKDSQEHQTEEDLDDVAQLRKVLQSPEPAEENKLNVETMETAENSTEDVQNKEGTILEDLVQEESNLEGTIQQEIYVEEPSQEVTNEEKLNTEVSNEEESNLEEANLVDINMEEVNQEVSNLDEPNETEQNFEERDNQEESNLEESSGPRVDNVGEESKEINDGSTAGETSEEKGESDKAILLVRDWGFDNEEESTDEVEDPESLPSRPTMEF